MTRETGWLVWPALIGVALGCLTLMGEVPRASAFVQPTPTLVPRAFLPLVQRSSPPAGSSFHLGYGANVSDAYFSLYLVDMGFDWAKGFADPADRENAYGPWRNVVNQLNWFLSGEEPRVRHVLLRVRSRDYTSPPLGDLADFQQRCHDLALYVKANYKDGGPLTTVAYEIWNEPNLTAEWGGHAPNPSQYVSLLAAAYQGIKSADPQAIVVSAGLATGGNLDDRTFLRGIYQAGGAAYFDALGSHPYGGNTPPGEKNAAVYFRRAEEQRSVMEEFGDADTPVWATEFGWIVERPDKCHDGHSWAEVTEAEQADYLVGALQYADENWPWMGPMFLLLDFGVSPYYSECEPLRWYSIYYRPFGQWFVPPIPRPAVQSLTTMEKHSAW